MPQRKRFLLAVFVVALAVVVVVPPWRIGCDLSRITVVAPYAINTGSVCFQRQSEDFLGWYPVFVTRSLTEHPLVKREISSGAYTGAKFLPVIDKGVWLAEVGGLLSVLVLVLLGLDACTAMRRITNRPAGEVARSDSRKKNG